MENIVIMAFVGFYIGLAKGGIGGPIAGAVILPALSQVMSVHEAVGITLPLLIFADVFAMRSYWKQWDMQYIRLLIPASLLGIVIGTLLLANLSDAALRIVLGVVTLLLVAYKLTSDSLRSYAYKHHAWHGYLAGFSSGVGSALANTGGPPITAYLLLQKVRPSVFVGTVTLFFFIVNLLKVPGYLIGGILDGQALLGVIWVLPLIPLGVWIGYRVVNWIDPRIFERLMVVLLVISAILLLFSTPQEKTLEFCPQSQTLPCLLIVGEKS